MDRKQNMSVKGVVPASGMGSVSGGKIAIISDSHDNIANTEKFLAWAKKNEIATIIHCGDVSAPSMIKKVIVPMFSGPIHLVHGNVSDRELLKKVCAEFKNVTLHGDEGFLEISHPLVPPKRNTPPRAGEENLKIAFCHFPERAKELAESGQYNLVFYGHTHKPWAAQLKLGEPRPAGREECRLVNPGEVAGQRFKPTFAIYDTETDKLELKILERRPINWN